MPSIEELAASRVVTKKTNKGRKSRRAQNASKRRARRGEGERVVRGKK